MKQTCITKVSCDNLNNENICGWIKCPLLMQKWGEALHFSLADLTSYLLSISLSLVSFFRSFSFLFKTFLSLSISLNLSFLSLPLLRFHVCLVHRARDSLVGDRNLASLPHYQRDSSRFRQRRRPLQKPL